MPRASTIKTHPKRTLIEAAMEQGIPAVEISARYGVSQSAISRHKSNRMHALAALIAEDTTAPDDLMSRLRELADSTRQARKLADATATPQVRARAASSELAVLDRLVDRLGLTDLSAVEMAQGAGTLTRALLAYVLANPGQASDLFAVLGQHSDLVPLRDALSAHLKEKKQ